ncbi:DUF1330 domain-containing protein [Rubellimicrobium sp. CFH 75288]|uniref:DUF1330 domain-containing protein n=1 Tax=Rubellimicrobium sp. CFH 75288 TaxID=2697034 RepID=UPI0014128760|nr:DUF1330 domain-containing protein [Rubellimicrobium sp. CFH 75288]NAZ36822.1 DUF1330 domain-containing protein [Rubellimicrobium sp. CFH 75288]
MTALWIANVHVTDPDRYAEYARRATGAIEAHGGVFLHRGGRHVHLEGRPRARNVVIRFPSVEAAQACYASPEYQEALAFARGAAERDMVVVEELPQP